MSNGCTKMWETAWSTEEIIDHADNWNLAGDVALLKTLESFADNMLERADLLNTKVNDLTESLDNTSLRLDIAQNEFQSLKNTQFIESRVYEDDETLPVQGNESNEKGNNINISEEERMKDMQEAVSIGLQVLDRYFDKIDVENSDSEEDNDFVSYVLQPKDPYVNRPLPYIIGSEEWHKKWHVGLEESSSSDSENDNKSETFSVTDSENELPTTNSQMKEYSDGSSELDLSSKNNSMRQPIAVSTANTTKQSDVFAGSGSDSDEASSGSVQVPKPSNSFAEQLAAKLGNVIRENVNSVEPEVNTRPIQKPAQNQFTSLFSDEPPPLDDSLSIAPSKGLFSGGQGLFDDDQDDDLWLPKNSAAGSGKSAAKSVSNIFEDDKISIASSNAASIPPVRNKMKNTEVPSSKGLFDNEDSSDEDIFSSAYKKQESKQSFLKPLKPTVPLFVDEPPALDETVENQEKKKASEQVLGKHVSGDSFKPSVPLFEDESSPPDVKSPEKKKPSGGVSIFGQNDIFRDQKIGDILKSRRKSSSQSEEGSLSDKKRSPPGNDSYIASKSLIQDKVEIPKKSEDVYPSKGDNEKSIGLESGNNVGSLFEDELPAKSGLFDEVTSSPVKKISLFDDNLFEDDLFSSIDRKFSSNLFDDDLFGTITPAKVFSNATSQGKSSLFEDDDEIFGESKEYQVVHNRDEPSQVSSENHEYSINIDAKNENERLGESGKSPNNFGEEDKPSTLFGDGVESNSIAEGNAISGSIDGKVSSFGEELNGSKILGTSEDSTYLNDPAASRDRNVIVEGNSTEKNVVVPSPHLSFCDPNPPPDDLWETNSDVFDDLEPDTNDGFSSLRSSLFDNEPPSLLFDTSSGIVPDQSNDTRIESVSSFEPHLTSTRRMSSEIFSDDQSNDSLFLTKAKNESSCLQPNLDSIPELPSVSDIEITPSGNIEELYDDSSRSISERDSSSNSEKRTPPSVTAKPKPAERSIKPAIPGKPAKTNSGPGIVTIRKVIDFEDIESKMVQPEASLLRDQLNDTVDAAKKSDGDTNVPGASTVRKSDPISPERNKIGILQDMLMNEGNKDADKLKVPGSPGKLKHNLNINVGALLPGFVRPKRVDSNSEIIETASPDTSDVLIQDVPVFNATLALEIPKTKPILDEATSFDTVDDVQTLSSVTKDRVRVPIKRRPSTRKGRQESLRHSVPDFKLLHSDFVNDDSDNDTVDRKEPEKEIFDKDHPKSATDNPKLPKSDDGMVTSGIEDIFNDVNTPEVEFKACDLFHDIPTQIKEDLFNSFDRENVENILKPGDEILKNRRSDDEKTSEIGDQMPNSGVEDSFVAAKNENNISPGASTRSSSNEYIDGESTNNKTDNQKPLDPTPISRVGSVFSPPGRRSDYEEKQSEEKPTVNANDEKKNESKLFENEKTDSDDEDLFRTISKDMKNVNNAKIVNTKPKDVLFEDNAGKAMENERNVQATTTTTKVASNPKTKNLFDSSDSEDDFLDSVGSGDATKGKKAAASRSVAGKIAFKTAVTKNLFEDDDGDDIFGSNVSSNQKRDIPRPDIIKKNRTVNVKKLENIEADEDPLSALLK